MRIGSAIDMAFSLFVAGYLIFTILKIDKLQDDIRSANLIEINGGIYQCGKAN